MVTKNLKYLEFKFFHGSSDFGSSYPVRKKTKLHRVDDLYLCKGF